MDLSIKIKYRIHNLYFKKNSSDVIKQKVSINIKNDKLNNKKKHKNRLILNDILIYIIFIHVDSSNLNAKDEFMVCLLSLKIQNSSLPKPKKFCIKA